MKLILSLVIGGLLLSPAAMAQQFGMDQGYQQSLATNSTADTGEGPHNNGTTTQDNQYIESQVAPWGNTQAPIVKTQSGTFSTFQGMVGNMINAPKLPNCRSGSMALMGGYFGAACGQAGSGGFSGVGGGSKLYPGLPPTSTSTVDLNTAY